MLEPMNRRNFVKTATVLAASPFAVPAADDKDTAIPEFQKPVFNLPKQVSAPVKIASIDLLQSGKQFFVSSVLGDSAIHQYNDAVCPAHGR